MTFDPEKRLSTTSLENKLDELVGLLSDRKDGRSTENLVVAFSGGVDSSVLLAAAHKARGNRCLAMTVTSPLQPVEELELAQAIASQLGVQHELVELDLLARPEIRRNGPRRCYHCKRHILSQLLERSKDDSSIVEGSNVDDAGDYRPGWRAVQELGVRSPLREAGLGKDEIRQLARHLGLPNYNRPAMACLASRVPYGVELSATGLNRVRQAEEILRSSGLGQLRVRDYGTMARLEVEPSAFSLFLDEAERHRILSELKKLGYTYVTLDLEGYRCGAMNEVLGDDSSAQREAKLTTQDTRRL